MIHSQLFGEMHLLPRQQVLINTSAILDLPSWIRPLICFNLKRFLITFSGWNFAKLQKPSISSFFWLSFFFLKKYILVRIFLAKLLQIRTKKLISKCVMACQHFRPPMSFTREYIRGCSNYVMRSRRVCVSFVVHARGNVRCIC